MFPIKDEIPTPKREPAPEPAPVPTPNPKVFDMPKTKRKITIKIT